MKGIGWKKKIRQNIFAYMDGRLIPSGTALRFSNLGHDQQKSSKTAKENSRVDRAKERSPVVRRLRQPRSTHEGSGQLRWVASLYASGNVCASSPRLFGPVDHLLNSFIWAEKEPQTCTTTKL